MALERFPQIYYSTKGVILFLLYFMHRQRQPQHWSTFNSDFADKTIFQPHMQDVIDDNQHLMLAIYYQYYLSI